LLPGSCSPEAIVNPLMLSSGNPEPFCGKDCGTNFHQPVQIIEFESKSNFRHRLHDEQYRFLNLYPYQE